MPLRAPSGGLDSFGVSLVPTNSVRQTDHRFPYVAGHRYEFEVEPAQGVELAVRGGDRQVMPSSQEPKVESPATGLHVVFSVTSAYTKGAILCHQDAVHSSLPTFEAPPVYNPQQPKETPSSPAATASAPSGDAESNPSTKGVPKQKPTSPDVRRSPTPSVAAALIATPAPAGTDNLAAMRASTEGSAPPPRAPASAAAADVLAGASSNCLVASVGGGTVDGFGQVGPPHNAVSRDQAYAEESNGQRWLGSGGEGERPDGRERTTVGSEQDARYRSSPVNARVGGRSPRGFTPVSPAMYPYHAQPYRGIAPEGAPAMIGGVQPSAGSLKWNPAWEQRLPTLPYIRRNVDRTSPRSAFEQHTARGSISGADRFVRPSGYFAHEPPIQRKRQVEASRAEDESHTAYHPPAHEHALHAPPPRLYHPGYASDVHSSVAAGREHHMPPDARNAGGGSHWGERGYDKEQPHASDHLSRWREDDDEAWARKSEGEGDVHLPTGYAYTYQPAAGRGRYRGKETRRYRSDHGGGRMNVASSLSGSSRRGYKNGNGLPPSGKESAKMVGAGGGGGGSGAALSDPSRGRVLAGGGAELGRGRRHGGVELTGHEEDHVSNGGYWERIATDSQARRGVDNIASKEPVS